MHGAGSDLATARQLVGDLLQKLVAPIDRDRPGGGHDGIELIIGKAKWR
jgi:hypothetical protein